MGQRAGTNVLENGGTMFPRLLSSIAVLAIAMVAATLPAAAAGNAVTGQQIAQRWCASCHLVSPDQKGANADVPTFLEIAKRFNGDLTGLAGFLANPHPPMPDLSLTRAEISDLLAYIGSLK